MRKLSLQTKATLAISGLLTTPAYAAELDVSVELPKLDVAEYHRPYVAVWIEDATGKSAADLAVWYQTGNGKEGHGTKWLPDLRQWWRKSGRELQVPIDGVTGPTRPAGRQTLKFDAKNSAIGKLAPGNYTLLVETVREAGGRELLKVPFTWPAAAAQDGSAQGTSELGAVTLAIKP